MSIDNNIYINIDSNIDMDINPPHPTPCRGRRGTWGGAVGAGGNPLRVYVHIGYRREWISIYVYMQYIYIMYMFIYICMIYKYIHIYIYIYIYVAIDFMTSVVISLRSNIGISIIMMVIMVTMNNIIQMCLLMTIVRSGAVVTFSIRISFMYEWLYDS